MSTFVLVALLNLAPPAGLPHANTPADSADAGTDRKEKKQQEKKQKKKKDGDEKTEEELCGTPSLGEQVDLDH